MGSGREERNMERLSVCVSVAVAVRLSSLPFGAGRPEKGLSESVIVIFSYVLSLFKPPCYPPHWSYCLPVASHESGC